MKLIEHIYGLFPKKNFAFPNGKYTINIANSSYNIECREVVVLGKNDFQGIDELEHFYNYIITRRKEFINSIPSNEDIEIVFYKEFFKKILEKLYAEDKKIKRIITKLTESNYCLDIAQVHEFDESIIKPIEFINKIRDKEGIKNAKKIFFNLARKFHEYVLVLRSPYEVFLDINYLNMSGILNFFCDENGKRVTNVNPFRFDYFSPEPKIIRSKIQRFLDKEMDMPLEDLFMSKSKTYLRLNNYSMAIIHAVIALEVIVPRYINGYLKQNNINKQAVEDFNNKFGLSVRVKALLKLMLPLKYHNLIPNVAVAIKYRNKIMHEGKINVELEAITNIDQVINDCESLINAIKVVGKRKKCL